MARVRAGEVQLGWREWGRGDVTVVFIHGNLASKDWIELAAPLFPPGVRVIGIDWRGCGESDRPKPTADFSNYSMHQHALDMLAALDELRIPFLSSRDPFHRRHYRRANAAQAAGALWTGVCAGSCHAAGHGVQCRADRTCFA